ncbi:hypothetical protein EV13_2819 [Prochlorococcus sp. MIT 0702]|nr:hypothetical protein EV13_2819 [Prochlorococcus sp. MIT 0702]
MLPLPAGWMIFDQRDTVRALKLFERLLASLLSQRLRICICKAHGRSIADRYESALVGLRSSRDQYLS